MSYSSKLPEPVDLSYDKVDGSDPNKPPIMIYHGIFGSLKDWSGLVKQISELSTRTVYYFDIRDHGNSPWTKEFSLKAAISDMVHFLNKNKINRAIFLGHSLGGLIFSRLVTLYPDLAEKLVIVDIHPKKEASKDSTNFMKLFALFLKQTVQTIRDEKITDLELAKKRLDELLKTHMKVDRKEYLDRIKIRNGQVDWIFNLDAIIEFLDKKTKDGDIIPNYTGPSLEIYGGKSMIFSKDDCESVLNFLPNCKFECIEDAGHSPHNTHPKEFIEKLLPFLNA